VIVLNTEFDPLVPSVLGALPEGAPVPPPPTVIGKDVADTGKPKGLAKGEVKGAGIQVELDNLKPPAPPPPPISPAAPPAPATTQ
jgi:hypothetical protein